MSYDRMIDQVCPHAVVDEPLFINPDRRTIRPLRPIASADSVKVRLNGQFEAPSYGATIPAQTTGSRRGPFTIRRGVNDTLRLRVGQGTTQVCTLPATNRITVENLAIALNKVVRGAAFDAWNGRMRLQSAQQGLGASVFVETGSTLAALLGLGVNREYRGKQISPGWTLVNDPRTLSDRPTRMIVFDDPLRSAGDFVEISYVTVQQECRRCGGIGIEHDWRYGTDGNTGEVRDEALLLQEMQKDVYTLLGSNPFHPWYGTTLIDAIGKKISASGFVQNLVLADIQQAFNRWQSIKRQQENSVGQIVTDREFPFQLLAVDIQQSTKDPTVVFVNIIIQNRSFQPITMERGIKLPASVAIAPPGAIRQSLSNFALTG